MNIMILIIVLLGNTPIDADYSALLEEIKTNVRLLNLKLVIESELLITKIFSVKGTLKIGQKTNPWICKIKDLNGETIIGSLYEKELLLSKFWMSYYP